MFCAIEYCNSQFLTPSFSDPILPFHFHNTLQRPYVIPRRKLKRLQNKTKKRWYQNSAEYTRAQHGERQK